MMKRELKRNEKKLLYLILIVSLLAFFLVLQSMNSHFLSALDNKINISMQGLQAPVLVEISKIINYVFDPVVFIVYFLIVICFLFYKKRKMEAAVLTFFMLISAGLLQLFKIIAQRPRPFDALISETDMSFPSGHSLMAVAFFGTLVYLFWHHIKSRKAKQWLTALAAVIIMFISLSRVYINVHWFSDILGSFAIGAFLLALFVLMTSKIHLFRSKD